MKKLGALILIGLFLTTVGCSSGKNETEKPIENIKKVKVKGIKEQSYPKTISYIGSITAGQIKAYSFKSSSRVANIYVEKGQKVTKGEKIADLQTEDLIYEKNASEKEMLAAKAQYSSAVNGAQTEDIKNAELDVSLAEENYNFAAKSYEDILALYNVGAISESDLEQAEMNKEQANIRLEQAKQVLQKVKKGATDEEIQGAKAQYEAAKIQYEANASLLEDAAMIADIDGYIVDVMYEAGEMVGAGSPVVILRNDNQIVQISVTQKDAKKLKVGDQASIQIDEIQTSGQITKIDQMPDTYTKTYRVELEIKEKLSDDGFYLGSTAKVNFNLENITGIWIDLLTIMNDGEDYVYIVQDDRAVRKNVQVQELYEDKVVVTGLEKGDQLIIEGMKSIKEGYKVELIR